MDTTDCIRLRKNNLCRLDLKPCKEKCPLRKTKEEQRLYREDMGDGKPWVPVKDWMKEGKDMTPDQLRAFAKYFYDRGKNQKTTRNEKDNVQ